MLLSGLGLGFGFKGLGLRFSKEVIGRGCLGEFQAHTYQVLKDSLQGHLSILHN